MIQQTFPARPVSDPVTWAVETTMFRALAVLRLVVVGFTFAVNLVKWDDLAKPGVVAAALTVIVLWTGFAAWAYDAPRRRRPPLFLADLALSAGLILLTPYVHAADHDMATSATLPSFWVAAVVLGWGIHWGWPGGLVASVVISLADLSIRPELTQTNMGNIFLLMIGGPLLGYCTTALKQMASDRDRAERAAAAAAERQRLARVVHDGVLQVLSLMQRRGAELGGEVADLGRLAGEQEIALRSLVQQGEAGPADPEAEVDLVGALVRLGSRTVTVSAPGTPVFWPAGPAHELEAVVRACLDNVRQHCGADAPAWVLLEDLPDRVVVTVRDDGPGIADGRLEQAVSEGRLGVAESICGRMRDLDGGATLVTGPGQGTEWELTLPRATV